jgi:PKD repeat protein
VDARRSVDLALARVCRISLAAATALAAVVLALAPGASPAAVNDIPVDFTWSPSTPTPGQVVTFHATADPAAGVALRGFDWDLDGNGSFDAHGDTATWSYPGPGPVTVGLRVKGRGGHRGEVAHTITVQPGPPGNGGGPPPQPPIASFTFAPAGPSVNQPVLFTSTASDPDGTITQQVWDLNGDGNYDNGGGATAMRTFSDPGDYVVALRVTDNSGLVSFDSQTVTVTAVPGAAATVQTQKAGARLLSPFPVVRIAGRITARGTRVRLLRVTAPVGSKVSVRCSGRGCPFKKQVRSLPTGAGSLGAVRFRVRRLERLVLPGVRVRIYVTKRGTIGKYTKLRFRAGNPPVRTDQCVLPGSWAPAACPAL